MSAIQTWSGRCFSPDPAAIEIDDIAHALANLCRFGGHCCLVADAVDGAALATERSALMRTADDEWWPELDGIERLDVEIDPWPPERAAREFLDRFERLA
jgi:hypothetical protein